MTDTRDSLVDAGVQIVDRDGLGALGIRAVAAATGVSHGAPRRYFPTLNSLQAAVARVGIDDLNERLRSALEQSLSDAAVAYWRFSRDRPHMFALIFRHDLLADAGGNLREVTRDWFTALVGVTGSTEAALAAWVSIHGLCTLAATNTFAVIDISPNEATVRLVVDQLRIQTPHG
ncbi:TetR/AcrR family transcriptional regulator [Williamsia sterculiae]|uniref:Transcriptional regulator, TetR family n=1 Tax=Williamsia sterculiae TaxID=1344003 RepID=A0A1N7FJR3_9NOCA|nr:TetR/AcrR family transcriptional regulator [Williamsia sterculiae]SIS00668.1 transcriptional regulator, TetR family [Williamsia sterculiae]